jgi:opacity protein-like surface antigen
MKLSRISLAAIAALSLSGVAQAQDVNFGAQVILSQPQGDLGDSDLMDGKMGFGLGFHALVDLKGGHAIVPRLDYVTYKRSEAVLGVDFDYKANILTLGADYNYYINGKANEGFYVLAGLGFASGKFEMTNSFMSALNVSSSKSTLYFQVGAGYMFTPNVGAELRYQSAQFSDVDVNVGGYTVAVGDLSAPSIQASVMFRF